MELACEKNRIWNEKSKIYSIKSEFKAKQIINYSFYLFKYVPVHPRKLHLRGGVQNDYNKGPFRPFRSLVGPTAFDCLVCVIVNSETSWTRVNFLTSRGM